MDGDENVLTRDESELRRWKESFECLMNEENEREMLRISKEKVRASMKRMKSGKVERWQWSS